MKLTINVKMKPGWEQRLDLGATRGALSMATDILSQAKQIAPVDTRALVNSGKIQSLGKGLFKISFGGGRIAYARRRHYENDLHPGSKFYLAKAANSVAKTDPKKYFRID